MQHRSTALLAAVAIAAGAGVTGCGSSDDETSAPPATAASKPAQRASTDRLDAADAAILRGVRQTVAKYCSGHKATAGEVTAAVATLESLYQIDPAAIGPDGRSVKQVAVAAQRRLRACGDRSAARRIAKLTG